MGMGGRTAHTGLQLYSINDFLALVSGAIIVLLTGPPVGAVVGSTVLWEAIDRGFAGGLVESGQELTGFIFGRIIPALERLTRPCACNTRPRAS